MDINKLKRALKLGPRMTKLERAECARFLLTHSASTAWDFLAFR